MDFKKKVRSHSTVKLKSTVTIVVELLQHDRKWWSSIASGG